MLRDIAYLALVLPTWASINYSAKYTLYRYRYKAGDIETSYFKADGHILQKIYIHINRIEILSFEQILHALNVRAIHSKDPRFIISL